MKRGGVELTMQLSDEDAKRMKARPAQAKSPAADSAADEAKAKAEAEAKAAAEAEEAAKAAAKSATPANKGRTPQDK